MQDFSEAAIPQALFHRLEQIGFTTPTPIQQQAIPAALEGADILGSAQTGTGKTGAFGIPLVTYLMNNSTGNGLVLLPTRELATQVLKALKQFIGNSKIPTALLIGGEDMRKQFNQLKAQPRLIVGTPGRINDHLERGSLNLSQTKFLVLDEVDRMLDMGFGIQLDAIARFLTSPNRQTLMFSATLPDNIKKVSAKYLKDPVRISVGASHNPAANIKQSVIKVSDAEKYQLLMEELNNRTGSIIIFVKTKRAAEKMAEKLNKKGFEVDAIHGDLRQNKRTKVIANFQKQSFRILVATDVAARGLDVPHIEHVINYDLPQCPEDYIHRIGRTARAGAEGEAVSFLSSADSIKWRDIQRLLNPDAKDEDFGGRPKKPRRNPRGRNSGFKGKGKPDFKSDSRSGKPSGKPSGKSFAKSGERRKPRADGAAKPEGKPEGKKFGGKPKATGEGKGKPQNRSDSRPNSRPQKSAKPTGGKPSGKPSGKPNDAGRKARVKRSFS